MEEATKAAEEAEARLTQQLSEAAEAEAAASQLDRQRDSAN